MARLLGRNIETVTVGDSAQAHIGDTIINHFHNAAQRQAKTYKILLESLTFDGMDARARNVAAALPKTCEWLLKNQEFVGWTDRARMYEHHGFLWIKGKPGSGKSTIMKETLAWAEKTWSGEIVLSYFFNARSPNLLEKSRLGLYRTLLYRLMCLFSNGRSMFTKTFGSKEIGGKVSGWTETELENFFVQLTKSSAMPPMTLFVDALDEGIENDVRQMVAFIESWTDHAITAGRQLRICLSSRHYPHISVKHGISLVIEDQDGHNGDIKLYLNRKLVGTNSSAMSDLRRRIRDRSAGVFLWIVLVVPILNQAYDQGKDTATMIRKLHEIPPALGDFFDQIILKDREDFDECVTLLQWVLFALRPLHPLELYDAIRQTNARSECGSTIDVSTDDVIRYLRNCSRGLVEVTKTKGGTVQFIHETVRDYLVGAGGLNKSSLLRLSGQEFQDRACHTKLAETSLLCLLRCHREYSYDDKAGLHKTLAIYAARYWWRHLIFQPGVCSPIVLQLALELLNGSVHSLFFWVKLDDPTKFSHRSDSTFDGLAPPLHYAAAIGIHELVDALLSLGADPNAHSWSSTALWRASSRGHDKVVRSLITAGANIEASPKGYGPALWTASCRGHETVVQSLVAAGADIEASINGHGTALCQASYFGHERVVQILVDAGANVEASPNDGRTPLRAACRYGYVKIVQILVNAGANLGAPWPDSFTALQRAAEAGRDEIVQILVDAGAELEASYRGTPLQIASYIGAEKVVQILVDAGADIEASTTRQRFHSPLLTAVQCGHEEVVEILLKAGANPAASSATSGSALQIASERSDTRILQMLIDAGAKVNASVRT